MWHSVWIKSCDWVLNEELKKKKTSFGELTTFYSLQKTQVQLAYQMFMLSVSVRVSVLSESCEEFDSSDRHFPNKQHSKLTLNSPGSLISRYLWPKLVHRYSSVCISAIFTLLAHSVLLEVSELSLFVKVHLYHLNQDWVRILVCPVSLRHCMSAQKIQHFYQIDASRFTFTGVHNILKKRFCNSGILTGIFFSHVRNRRHAVHDSHVICQECIECQPFYLLTTRLNE